MFLLQKEQLRTLQILTKVKAKLAGCLEVMHYLKIFQEMDIARAVWIYVCRWKAHVNACAAWELISNNETLAILNVAAEHNVQKIMFKDHVLLLERVKLPTTSDMLYSYKAIKVIVM